MLPTNAIRVTAIIEINADQDSGKVLEHIKEFCEQMESEEGCLLAQASQNIEQPRQVLLWEIYQDKQAIEAHFAMAHTQAFINSNQTTFISGYQSQALTGTK